MAVNKKIKCPKCNKITTEYITQENGMVWCAKCWRHFERINDHLYPYNQEAIKLLNTKQLTRG